MFINRIDKCISLVDVILNVNELANNILNILLYNDIYLRFLVGNKLHIAL